MSPLKKLLRRRRGARARELERQIEEELRAHLEMLVEEYRAEGMSPEGAAVHARRRFGDIVSVRSECLANQSRMASRRMRTFSVGALLMDVRSAGRMFRKNPGFTAVAVLTLGLGIGANTTVFSVVDSVLLRPMPYRDSDRLVVVQETRLPEWSAVWVSPGNFYEWRRRSTSFVDMGAHETTEYALTGVGEPVQVRAARITPNLFPILGTDALHGRTFLPEEAEPGNDGVVILSHRLWRQNFGGQPNTVGQTITLNDRSFQVVGVMPESFEFPITVQADHEGAFATRFDMWVPLALSAEERQRHGRYTLQYVTARLAPNVTLERARRDLDAVASQLEEEFPRTNKRWGVRVDSALDYYAGDVREALVWLFAAVGLILMIASTNVAAMLLARAIERQQEIEIRRAIGAGRWRLVRQLLVEGLILGFAAALLGLAIAYLGIQSLLSVASDALPRFEHARIDGVALGYASTVTLIAVLVCSLAPALRVAKTGPAAGLNRAAGHKGGGTFPLLSMRRRMQPHGALVVAQTAFSLLVLAGSGLMIRSFAALLRVDPGFPVDNLLVAHIDLPPSRYPDNSHHLVAFYQRLIEEVSALPGVLSVSAGRPVPFAQGPNGYAGVKIEGVAPGQPTVSGELNGFSVHPDYFQTMGIPVLSGRVFSEADRRDDWSLEFLNGDAFVAVISESTARRDFPGDDPVGKRMNGTRIVGVVGDVFQERLDGGSPSAQYYLSILQNGTTADLILRTTSDPSRLVPEVRESVWSLDADLPVTFVTMEEAIADSLAPRRFAMALMSVLGGLALLLSASGIYAVAFHAVARRTREFAVRRALGARYLDLLQIVLASGLSLSLTGVGLGLLAALWLARTVTSQLYGISAHDPVTLLSASFGLVVVTLAASYVPARRATRADPREALRAD